MTQAPDAQTIASPDQEMWLVPHTAVTRSLTEPTGFRIAWGEGPARDEITDLSPALAEWLLSLNSPVTPRRMAHTLQTALRIPSAEASALVAGLINRGLFASQPHSLSEGHRIWSAIGWHDAAALHSATRDTALRYEPLDAPTDDLPSVTDHTSVHAVALPPVSRSLDQADFFTAFKDRRTHRNFQNTTLTVQQLADLLHWTFRPAVPNGPAAAEDSASRPVTPFSAQRPGADLPAEPLTAFVLLDPKTGPAELLKVDWRFRYSARHHTLEPAGNGPKIESISELLWDQDFSVGAPAFIIFCVNWREYMARHRSSYGYRLSQLDLGSFMQTALVAASALHLRTFLTPALDDERFAQILGTEDSEQAPCYMLAIGGRES
ncbi:hypothetical protein F4553_000719 [Allocatelliglobosispora scoriae]|uniref:Nitroreductase domain-containing protein n=1 Tax=Allocatelliglobosispora scoriae TaxID=643052 RepID=A0A841BKJ9_9ACTN|nr:nitroreductase family protein [Allocatelliglobosispora scoriae]MBB5867340.1 hypothetical protein [Allocatelliglobosispora scoriae]